MLKILVTGAAGFIGYHSIKKFLEAGYDVIGVDNLNDYYDPALKDARLSMLNDYDAFTFIKANIADKSALDDIVKNHSDITHILHLAAQAGVRYSIENPYAYGESNLTGHLNILEVARSLPDLKHFMYASSSSVYGDNKKIPFATTDVTDTPVSLYAATKKAAELMTHSYVRLYKFPATGFRFFTVYGPFGRPDMAYFSFTKDILEGRPIKVFNNGDMRRDFTWIDDIVDGIAGALNAIPQADAPHTIGGIAHRVFNLGNNTPERLGDFIDLIEKALGQEAEKIMLPMQAGDVYETYADIHAAQDVFGYNPSTPLSKGIPQFIEWYKDFYQC